MRARPKKQVIALGDLICMVAALAAMLYLRENRLRDPGILMQYLVPFSFIFPLWLLTFYTWNLYNLYQPVDIRHFMYAMVLNIGIAAIFYYTWPALSITPKTNLLILGAIFTSLFAAWRAGFATASDKFGSKLRVLLIGGNPRSFELAKEIIDRRRMGYRLAGVLLDEDHEAPAWMTSSNVCVLKQSHEIKDFVEKEDVDRIVVSEGWLSRVFPDLFALLPTGVQCMELATFWEEFGTKIPIFSTHEIWFIQNLTLGRRGLSDALKRTIDIVLALVLLPLGLVLGMLTAIAIKLTSAGAVLYSQERIGLNNRRFTIYKFRSMFINSESNGAQWAAKDDPRITPVGRFIRTVRFDELPQLFNILRGDMSFIGPRPERPEFEDLLTKEIPYYELRHLLRPGLTGWAQVNYPYGNSVEDAARKLEYDLYYLKNRSVLLDLKILLKTIMVVLSRKGT